jgi:hypothetical protein
MQRWLKLPDGRYIDANSIVYVGRWKPIHASTTTATMPARVTP